MNIALLEDHPAIIDYMTTALTLHGHAVFPHIDSDSLLDALFDGTTIRYPLAYDLLIVDLYLPRKLSGTHVVKYIQHFIAPETLPVIIISAADMIELEKSCADLSTTAALRKPFRMNTLLQAIEHSRAPKYTRETPRDRALTSLAPY